MSNEAFDDVTVTKRANVYYDGGVTSRTLVDDGARRTLGIMHPGDYEFETDCEEHLDLYAGRLEVTIDGETTTYEAGDSFIVPANTTFDVSVSDLVDYCCTYE
ncbi:pyrimidine/purine nucleoside phosphorylase [Natronomonas sp.]|uniref:pyrimidine/purine nucleoside phosphorylase n=1 Tax=Natronomonas sp. TaxID=2184060 RepID=UPI003976CBDE